MTTARFLSHSVVALAALLGGPGLARGQDIDQCIDSSEKAVAQRKAGKLIEARASLARCSASTCPQAVSTSCQQRLGDVIRSIPSIVFTAKDGSGNDLAAVKLSVDGAAYSDHLDGSAIELDPGEHDFRFEVAGQAPVVQGADDARNANAAAAGTADQPPANDAGSSTQRTAAAVVVGVGAAGLVAGGIFGALSLSAHSSYEKDCGSSIGAPPGYCNLQGVSGESDAANKGTFATAFLVAGGAIVAIGAVWYFLAPRGGNGVQVGLGPGGISMRGEF
jgi:hypothetical protein